MNNEKSKMSTSDIFGIIGGAFSIVSSIFMAYQEYKFHKEEMDRRNDDIKLLAKELSNNYISATKGDKNEKN